MVLVSGWEMEKGEQEETSLMLTVISWGGMALGQLLVELDIYEVHRDEKENHNENGWYLKRGDIGKYL